MHRAVVPLLFALVLGLRALPAAAFHYITPALVQIPPVGVNPGTIQNPHWGGLRFVLFDSDADLLNNGSTGRQVYLFDLQLRDVQGILSLTQLTSAPLDDNQRGRTGRRAVMIVYDARIGGAGPRQLMLIDRHTGVRTQLTNGAFDSKNASVDDGERIVVFESAADFFDTGAGGTQIYRVDLRRALLGCPFPCAESDNAGLTQLTNKTGNNRNAVTSNSGKTIVFESDADLLNVGQNENQIYLYDGKRGLTLAGDPRPGRGTQSDPHARRRPPRLRVQCQPDRQRHRRHADLLLPAQQGDAAAADGGAGRQLHQPGDLQQRSRGRVPLPERLARPRQHRARALLVRAQEERSWCS